MLFSSRFFSFPLSFFSFATHVIGFISVGKTFLAKLWNLFKGIVCIGRVEDRPRISNILFSGQFCMFVYFFSWLLSLNRAHLGHDSKNVIHWFSSVRSYQQNSVSWEPTLLIASQVTDKWYVRAMEELMCKLKLPIRLCRSCELKLQTTH